MSQKKATGWREIRLAAVGLSTQNDTMPDIAAATPPARKGKLLDEVRACIRRWRHFLRTRESEYAVDSAVHHPSREEGWWAFKSVHVCIVYACFSSSSDAVSLSGRREVCRKALV